MSEPTRFPEKQTIPAINKKGLNPRLAQILAEAPEGTSTGVGCTKRPEPTGVYNKAECEYVLGLDDLDGKMGGVGIVIGRDRPHSVNSGYGGKGDTQAFAIRLTAGYGACSPGFFLPPDEGGYYPDINPNNQKTLFHNPSNRYDGATLYLSQKCDVDKDFYCADGSMGGPVSARSAAVMKADAVRVISRDGGIKIIANTDTHHAGGKKTRALPTIDFIVNNDDLGLQPLAKGDNLNDAMKQIKNWINEILIQISNLSKSQMDFHKAVAKHTHKLPDSAAVIVPTPLGPTPTPVSSAPPLTKTSVSINNDLASAAGEHAAFAGGTVEQNLLAISSVLDDIERDYLSPSGPNYILSRNVNTT
jgi:hypothetical protein